MARKKKTVYDNNLIEALKKLPFSIYDKRHNLTIYLDDDRARSNQSRFEHISNSYHKLTVKDIESIPEGIKAKSKLKKDPIRKNTYNYYFIRRGDLKHFIKVSVETDDKDKQKVKIRTIYVTSTIK